MSRLVLAGVSKSFPGVQALDEVAFDVEAGEVHALVGENGAGKSTLIGVLGGAHVPDAGTITLEGTPLPLGDPLAVRRRGVQVIHQEQQLVAGLTAAENVFLGREVGRPWLRRKEMAREAQRLLDALGGAVAATTRVSRLSVAERQRVEIARALGSNPRVLVLDEPTSTLPAPDVARLLALLGRLRAQGLSIVYVSHRLEEVYAIADRITVLRDGRNVGTAPARDLDRRTLIRWMVGREVEEEFPPRTQRLGAPVLEARGLLAGADVTVRAGEIVGLAGLVGSGRTELGLALFGAASSGGEVHVAGRPVSFRSPGDALAAGLAYLTEDRKAAGLFPWLDVGANVTIASLARFAKGPFLDRRGEREAAQRSTEAFQVRSAGLGQRAGTLSGGNQQKLLLARFLLEPRRVLVLDEPTRGIDVGARAEIYRLMNRLTEEGLGILMISSDLEELIGMSDRVVVLRDRRTVGTLPRGEATPERVMGLATGAEAA